MSKQRIVSVGFMSSIGGSNLNAATGAPSLETVRARLKGRRSLLHNAQVAEALRGLPEQHGSVAAVAEDLDD